MGRTWARIGRGGRNKCAALILGADGWSITDVKQCAFADVIFEVIVTPSRRTRARPCCLGGSPTCLSEQAAVAGSVLARRYPPRQPVRKGDGREGLHLVERWRVSFVGSGQALLIKEQTDDTGFGQRSGC